MLGLSVTYEGVDAGVEDNEESERPGRVEGGRRMVEKIRLTKAVCPPVLTHPRRSVFIVLIFGLIFRSKMKRYTSLPTESDISLFCWGPKIASNKDSAGIMLQAEDA